MKVLQDELDNVILKVGDIIVDTSSGYVGILFKRERKIDMFLDDLYFWHIKWIKNIDWRAEDPTNVPLSNYVEEEGMKLSIVAGMLTWHSVNGGTYEF